MKLIFESRVREHPDYLEYIVSISNFYGDLEYEVRKLVYLKYDNDVRERLLDEMFYEAKRRVTQLLFEKDKVA